MFRNIDIHAAVARHHAETPFVALYQRHLEKWYRKLSVAARKIREAVEGIPGRQYWREEALTEQGRPRLALTVRWTSSGSIQLLWYPTLPDGTLLPLGRLPEEFAVTELGFDDRVLDRFSELSEAGTGRRRPPHELLWLPRTGLGIHSALATGDHVIVDALNRLLAEFRRVASRRFAVTVYDDFEVRAAEGRLAGTQGIHLIRHAGALQFDALLAGHICGGNPAPDAIRPPEPVLAPLPADLHIAPDAELEGIADLLGTRVMNIFRRYGFQRLDQVARLTRTQLLDLEGVGEKSAREIDQLIAVAAGREG